MNPRLPELERFKREWDEMWLDEDLDRRRARKEWLIAWKGQICREDEQELVASLRARGFEGISVWDLVNNREAYPELIGVLKEEAQADYLPPIREGIFRALTVRESGEDVLCVLVEQWRRGVGNDDRFLRWALANAISYLTPSKQVAELVQWIDGDEYSDGPFVRRLKRSETGRKALAAKMEKVAA